MNIQQQNSAHHFRMQSEREQTLGLDDYRHTGSWTIAPCLAAGVVVLSPRLPS